MAARTMVATSRNVIGPYNVACSSILRSSCLLPPILLAGAESAKPRMFVERGLECWDGCKEDCLGRGGSWARERQSEGEGGEGIDIGPPRPSSFPGLRHQARPGVKCTHSEAGPEYLRRAAQ
eukprot:706492-Hanusia_phi.AAC.2